jgi:hypothetical protein
MNISSNVDEQFKKIANIKMSDDVKNDDITCPYIIDNLEYFINIRIFNVNINITYIEEIFALSIKNTFNNQNLYIINLFIAKKYEKIFEQIINYPSERNIELIREILISELYPFIDENVYMETYTIKDNIIYKLKKWITEIVIYTYTINENCIDGYITIDIFIKLFKKYFLLNEDCWNPIISKFINENINNIFEHVSLIRENDYNDKYLHKITEKFLLLFFYEYYSPTDEDDFSIKLIIYYIVVHNVYNKLITHISNKHLVISIINMTDEFFIPCEDDNT